MATALAHITEPMPTLPAAVPTDLLDVITRCLAKEPRDRPASAREIAVTLGVSTLEATIPHSSGSDTARAAVGREAKLIDILLPSRGRALVVGCGTGRIALDVDALGHRVIAVDPSDELLTEAAQTSSGVGWVKANPTDISLERLGETAPFDIAVWVEAPLPRLDPGERGEILRRILLCLGPTGRVVLEFTPDQVYTDHTFRDDYLPAGMVPDGVFRSWDLRPQTVESSSSVHVLSRR